MSAGALVPAAGQGVRLGAGVPKALRELAGEPLLVHAVRGLRASPELDVVIIAAPPGDSAAVAELLATYEVKVVEGGVARSDSVARALAALAADVEFVLVHDAARCLTPPSVVSAVLAALRAGAEAVVPVLPVADTVKRVAGERVVDTLARDDLRAVQTPQGFRRDVLEAAHRHGGERHTDDAGMVEALGRPVVTVPGHDEAFKVTRPLDLLLAEAVLRARG